MLIISIAALVVSLLSLVVSLSRKGDRVYEAKVTAKHVLGQRYAEMALVYAKSHAEAGDLEKLRKHALDAFSLIDKSADGKRDFTDAQALVYLRGAQ
jgi:hypothetical protein